MKAMILAAGLGTRLKPLTDNIPKALVEVEGKPMLERVILKLKDQGFSYIIVNTHHFADKVRDFLSQKDYGIEIAISDESGELLDTGGGIAKAYSLIFKYDNEPVLVHNVDILSNADLRNLYCHSKDFSRLLVSERESSRKLLFNAEKDLIGWHNLNTGHFKPVEIEKIFDKADYEELSFSGIYVLTRDSIEEMIRLLGKERYSIMDYFLHPERSLNIKGFKAERINLLDIGKPESLRMASTFL